MKFQISIPAIIALVATVPVGILLLIIAFNLRASGINEPTLPPNTGRKAQDGGAELITGIVTERGNKIVTGVIVIASTGPISDPPPPISAAKPPKIPLYVASSGADGSYSLEVAASASAYNMRAFYSILGPNDRFITTSKTRSKIMVKAGTIVPDQNFEWP